MYVLLEKLHTNHTALQESSAPPKASEEPKSGSKDTAEEKTLPNGRKANFFDRKRFVDYE